MLVVDLSIMSERSNDISVHNANNTYKCLGPWYITNQQIKKIIIFLYTISKKHTPTGKCMTVVQLSIISKKTNHISVFRHNYNHTP